MIITEDTRIGRRHRHQSQPAIKSRTYNPCIYNCGRSSIKADMICSACREARENKSSMNEFKKLAKLPKPEKPVIPPVPNFGNYDHHMRCLNVERAWR